MAQNNLVPDVLSLWNQEQKRSLKFMSNNHQLSHAETNAKELDKRPKSSDVLRFDFIVIQATMINNYCTSIHEDL